MMEFKTKKWILLFPFLLLLLLGWNLPDEQVNFLNDRASEITGGSLLTVPGVFNATGLSGRGQIVALADSGLDKGSISDIHPDLQSQEGQMPKVIALNSWAGRDKADDPDGHGTHMASTIAGTGAENEQWRGLAPGASLYFQGLLNNKGKIALPEDLSVLFKPAYEAGARIHVDAWGTSGNYYNNHARQIDAYMQHNRDFLVILAAGNNGSCNGTLTCEANSKNALVVGASASVRLGLDDTYQSSSATADFSSCGPTVDGRIKPEILAPGTSIISASSSLVKGNLSNYPQYTSMQGSSMSAAVTAGSTALLRELLAESWHMSSPSAALLKALLLEGARTEQGPSQKNFGILDLAATAIAIQENMVSAEEEGVFLEEGLVRNYNYWVNDSQKVFKATLVWTDPAGLDGRENYLINDLDLVVIAPDGSELMGNHFLGTGQKDNVNNVEQVYIPAPQTGKYTVQVRGASLYDSSAGQQFALVYGQLPNSELLTGQEIRSSQDLVVLNRVLQNNQVALEKGYRQYQASHRSYIWGKTWNPAGAGLRINSQGTLWYEAAKTDQIEGYQQAAEASVKINGVSASPKEEAKIPIGTGLQAVIDPLTQTLQTAKAAYQVYQGKVISTGSKEQKSLVLENYPNSFRVADQAVYQNNYHIIKSDQFLSAFSSPEIGEYQNILAGMEVSLVQNAYSKEIQALLFARDTIIGNVQSIQQEGQLIMLDSGMTYQVEEGATILLHNCPASLNEIKPGYMVSLMLSGDKVAGLAAWGKTAYGQIIFISETDREIYFRDLEKGMQIYKMTDKPKVIRWGTEDILASLQGSSNLWAMLMFSADGQAVETIKIAEKAGDISGFITSRQNGIINLTGGEQFYFSNYTKYLKNNFPVLPVDFVVGEDIDASVLYTSNGDKVGAVVSTQQADNLNPELKYLALYLNNYYTVIGQSDADAVYLWRENNLAVTLSPNKANHQFYYKFQPDPEEISAQLVAVQRSDGDVNGANLDLEKTKNLNFSDLQDSWGAQAIQELVQRKVLQGYEDGTIRPEADITRQEMAVILARCFGWQSEYGGGKLVSDETEIAAWAYDSVYRCLKLGMMNLYSSMTFRPKQYFSRENLANLVGNLRQNFAFAGLQDEGISVANFRDLNILPEDAMDLYGIYQGRADWVQNREQPVSRAFAAVILVEIIHELEAANN